jgi:hypothetical protein
MLSSKIRTTIITLLASAGFALAAALPAASQAQWHTICYGGVCTTHSNYTYGNPCSSGGSAASVSPEQQKKEEERKKKEAEEGKVHGEEVEQTFYGCNGPQPPPSGSGGTVSPPSVTVGRVAGATSPSQPASAIP